jgi:hypothetical protein
LGMLFLLRLEPYCIVGHYIVTRHSSVKENLFKSK